MGKNMDSSQQDLMRQAMQLAQTQAGRQLIDMLQKNGGQEFQQAMAKAAAGDYTQAKQSLSTLLSTPEAKALLDQLGGGHG